jgi:TolA-binding protein
VEESFLPVRVHVREQAEEFRRLSERYDAQWTPAILVLDSDGEERHRIEGFLPAREFVAQLLLGIAHAAFHRHDWSEAERRFREVMDAYAETDAAPEALYWAGVARYKGGDAAALTETARAFTHRYDDTTWAKKASVWGAH